MCSVFTCFNFFSLPTVFGNGCFVILSQSLTHVQSLPCPAEHFNMLPGACLSKKSKYEGVGMGGVPEWAGDTNDWCVRSGDMGTVGPSKVRKSPCKIVVPHSSVANRNSHAGPPEPISLIVAEVSPT